MTRGSAGESLGRDSVRLSERPYLRPLFAMLRSDGRTSGSSHRSSATPPPLPDGSLLFVRARAPGVPALMRERAGSRPRRTVARLRFIPVGRAASNLQRTVTEPGRRNRIFDPHRSGSARDVPHPSEKDPHRGRMRAPVAYQVDRLVEIDRQAGSKNERFLVCVTRIRELSQPPAEHPQTLR